ncbi:putative autotransporter protein [Helicobacter mustelae 12198]|uniref:Putative autotransporter protein n=2 Tax=Helicobacter mustelae TaxID=217 RepID=D3UFQ6_HELM1|nr:putative autotransporter protein [Helicobacter mustelae 12198]SQH70839.1 autotransporter protein [Helicobacter mustelae]
MITKKSNLEKNKKGGIGIIKKALKHRGSPSFFIASTLAFTLSSNHLFATSRWVTPASDTAFWNNCLSTSACPSTNQGKNVMFIFMNVSGANGVGVYNTEKLLLFQIRPPVYSLSFSDANFERRHFDLGDKSMIFDFGSQDISSERKFTVTAGYKFVGNIEIDNTGNNPAETNATAQNITTKGVFDGRFTSGMEGNILIQNQGTNTFALAMNMNSAAKPGSIILGQNNSAFTTFRFNPADIFPRSPGVVESQVVIYANLYRYQTNNESSGLGIATVNFSGDGVFQGNIGGVHDNINPNAKAYNVYFSNGAVMKGNIITGTPSSGKDYVQKIVSFGSGNVTRQAVITSVSPYTTNASTVWLEGNIISYGIGGTTTAGNFSQKQGGNIVAFQTGTMKGNIEARHLSNASPGYNQVQFLQDGVVYEGNITASGGENVLFFGRKESKTVGSSSSGGITPAASGNGTADNGKLQTIFTGNGDTFKGNLLAENGGKNTMTFYKNGKIEGSTGIVQITANNASNTIELRNGGSITNARILSQEGGKNSIGFSTSDGGASSASQTGGSTGTGSTTPNSKFDAISSGNNSSTTILLQTPMTLDANITYGGHFAGNSYVYDGSNNTVTLFFANKRSEGTTAPSTTPSNNASQTRAASQASNTSPVNSTSSTTELAASFKDGISLQLQDKSINLDGKDGTYSTSFISTAMSHGLGANSTTPLHVRVIKSGDANNVNNSITLSGIAVGSVSALSSSDATNPAAINSTYTINLQNKSIFLGSFSKDLQNSHTKVNLVLEHNAKFIADSSTQLENLTIQAATFDKNDSATPTLLQNNTVVDVASGGGSNNITREGNTFYLLSIGKDPTNIAQATGGASNTSQTGGSTTPNNALGANGLSGSNALFKVYVNTNANQGSNGSNNGSGAALNNQHSSNGSGLYGYIYSDRVIVHNVKNSASGNTITRSTGGSTSTATSITPLTEYLQILASGNVSSIKYHGGGTETKGNIGVATVRNDASGKALVDFKTIGTIVGFDALDTKLIAIKTDAYGKVKNNGLIGASGAGASGGTSGGGIHGNDYTTYFLQSGVSGTSRANQLASATALASNYYLYLANINSLNKRLGELRNNPHANGVWIRLFNGMQTTTFALQTKSIYTTLQGGYDYAFGSEGANDYLGFAISYANAGMDSLMRAQAFNHAQKGIKSSSGNAFEIALYNSYVQDGATRGTNFKNGLYSDSIIKLSFLANKIKLAGNNNTPSVNNFGFTFSQEIGYRFLLGENQEWYITPQGELTLGYLNQSNLKQVLGSHYLSGVQTSIFTLQGRIGSSFGYRFYQFTADKNYYPEIYLGLYGVGNYIGGGDITLISNLGSVNALRTLGSTGRFLFNLGTNFTIKDNHRVYFDFERSFGGRIIVDYQFNIGYRYSFGENKKYASLAGSISQTIKRDEKKQNKEEITE